MTATKEQEHLELVAIVNRINTTLQSKWRSAQNDYDSHQEKERHRREYIRQLELDVDDEIESMKSSYVKEIQFCNGNVQQLTISVKKRSGQFLLPTLLAFDFIFR